ncbi:MAG: hypothetical protein AAB131_17145 [Actinomycetota bacterium]
MEKPTVWVFHGDSARHAAAIFNTAEDGSRWIAQHRLSGILTEYPVGEGCYDIAVSEGHFRPTKPHHGTAAHIAGFSPGWTRHMHYLDGHPA